MEVLIKNHLTFSIYRTARKAEKGDRLYLFSPSSTRFTNTGPLAGRLLQKANLCAELVTGLKLGTFGLQVQATHY